MLRSKPPTNHVPPGHGKPATQNRNARRRLKKQYDRLAASGQLEGIDGTNAIPLGQRRTAASASASVEADAASSELHEETFTSTPGPVAGPSRSTNNAQPTFMMASLSNKNKRKGFKQAMASTLPKKIVFATSSGGDHAHDADVNTQDADALPFTSVPSSELDKTAPSLFPRLIPPSEKQEKGLIPANMIVTSVDVEEGMWPVRKKLKGKKHQQADYTHAQSRARQTDVRTEMQEVEDVVLDYGEGEGDASVSVSLGGDADQNYISTQREHGQISGRVDDWSLVVAAKWESATKISDVSQLSEGSLVAWKVSIQSIPVFCRILQAFC